MTFTRSRIAIVVGVLVLLLGTQVFATTARAPRILSFDTMVGIPQGLVGANSLAPLRGIPGGFLPWTLSSGHGYLTTSGDLKIEVTGLVLVATGQNPLSTFKALVSCVTSNGTFDNILTGPFPATIGPASAGGGDSDIETTVSLPSPCIAPIVFAGGGPGAWFAATGN